jgi:methionyl-tRNA formyltransferase
MFLGTPALAVPTLTSLAASSLRPVGVVTEADKPVGRRLVQTSSAIAQAAEALGLPVFKPTSPSELETVVRSLEPTLGIVVAYGRLLRPPVLATPIHGFVNLHFSLLPRYRGATPIQAALLAGDDRTGVTLMQLDAGLETGPLVGATAAAVAPTEPAGSLTERLAQIASELAIWLIPRYLSNETRPGPQAPTNEPPTKRLKKADGRIDWTQPAARLDRFIRAMTPWPGAWTEQAGKRIIIRQAHLEKDRLVLDVVQVAGRSQITGSQFARGYRSALTALVDTGTVAPLI